MTTNPNRTVLYVGTTDDLRRRMQEHREKKILGFTAKYNVDILIWYDSFSTPQEAINAEKRIKGWKRDKKIKLINEMNPELKNLIT